MTARRALVIGGSLGGLLAAHLLRREGWDATVFERNAEDLAGRGAGISTHPQLLDILRCIGIDFDESMGVRVENRDLPRMRAGASISRRGRRGP